MQPVAAQLVFAPVVQRVPEPVWEQQKVPGLWERAWGLPLLPVQALPVQAVPPSQAEAWPVFPQLAQLAFQRRVFPSQVFLLQLFLVQA